MTIPPRSPSPRALQTGAAAVEFAVSVSVFLALVFGVIQFALFMYVLNAESEATRLGSRLYVVCGSSRLQFVRDRMHDVAPAIPANATYVGFARDNSCTSELDCDPTRVSIRQNLPIPSLHSLLGSFAVPRIPITALTQESMGMGAGVDAASNPACN